MQVMWQDILMFFQLNPEYTPAVYILLSYIGIYLVTLVTARLVVAVKGNRKPFTDQIVHWLLILFMVSLAIVTVILVIDMARDSMLMLVWYHYAVYAVLFVSNALVAAALIASVNTVRKTP